MFFDVKAPGEPFRLQRLTLHFDYDEEFKTLPEAYQTLLLDLLRGDQTLFVHADEVEASWRVYAPLLARTTPPNPYPAGSWGPAETKTIVPDRDPREPTEAQRARSGQSRLTTVREESVFPDADALSHSAAAMIEEAAAIAMTARGRFTIALSGGIDPPHAVPDPRRRLRHPPAVGGDTRVLR